MTTANIVPVNVGLAPNDGLGDPLRTSFQLLNQDVQQLGNRVQTALPGGGNVANLAGSPTDQVGWITFDPNYLYYCWGNYANAAGGNIWNQIDITGNATTIANGTSNITIPSANSEVYIYAGGNLVANFVPNDVTGNTNAAFTGNVSIAGNLNVIGNINYSNTTQTVTTDPIIELAANNISDFIDIGFVGQFVTGNTGNQYTGLIRQASTGTYKLFSNIFIEPANTINFANAVYNTLEVGNIQAGFGNIVTTGNVDTGNINVTSAAIITGNATAANFVTAGNVSATNTVNAGNVSVSGQANVTGNINAIGNVSGTFILGNGAFLSGMYSNANATAFLANLTSNVTTTANVQANAMIANLFVGSTISANTANISGNATVTGNLNANFFLGNGQFLTGVISNYNDSNVANFLPTYTGNLVSLTGNVTTTANIQAEAVIANLFIGPAITANSANINGNATVTGNLNANFFLGNGQFLTGVVSSYNDSNVANYLPTYTGNLVSLTGNVTTTANVQANNILSNTLIVSGNISAGNINSTNTILTNTIITSGLANVNSLLAVNNVVTDTALVTTLTAGGNITGANLQVFGNIEFGGNIGNSNVLVAAGTYIFGNGAFITGLNFSNYSNADVANYLPTYTGGLDAMLGNISGGNANIINTLVAGTANAFDINATSNVTAGGNVTAAFFNGNIANTTGGYSNTQVASYLSSNAAFDILFDGNIYTDGEVHAASIFATGNTLTGNIGFISTTGNIYSNQTIEANANVIANGLLVFNTVTANGLQINGNANVTGNISANYFLGNGSQLTGVSNYANANAVAHGEAGWGGNIVPNANATYSLGNSTNYWSNVWVAGNTLYLGGTPLGMGAGNVLTVNGNSVLINGTDASVTTTGNIGGGNLVITSQANVGTLNATGNIAGGNIAVTGNVNGTGLTLTGNITSQVTYGAFYSNVTQTNSNVGNAIPITYNNIDIQNGVVIVANTEITIRKTGIYNIQFSVQLEKTSSGASEIYIWLDKNGTNVPDSGGQVELVGNGAKSIATWNYVVSATANDYYRLLWLSASADVQHTAIVASGQIPAIPSVILTVIPVGA